MNEGNDRTVLDIVSDLIDDLVKYCYEQINNYEHRTDGLTPLPGSPGSEELKDEKYKEYINNAYDIGNLLFTNIGEYLEAFSRSLRTFSLVFPPWALARMIFETSAKVMEFFEANITTEKKMSEDFSISLGKC